MWWNSKLLATSDVSKITKYGMEWLLWNLCQQWIRVKRAISTNHVRFCLNKGRASRHYAKPPTVQDAFQSIQGLASSAALGKLEVVGTGKHGKAIRSMASLILLLVRQKHTTVFGSCFFQMQTPAQPEACSRGVEKTFWLGGHSFYKSITGHIEWVWYRVKMPPVPPWFLHLCVQGMCHLSNFSLPKTIFSF